VCQAPAVAGESRMLDVEIAPTELPGREMLPADPALAKYVLAVRDLAYGRPQANSPTAARASEVH
jgi:hypothetical protein